ncbi:hypothetical protein [Micromonospora chersina]
MSPGRSVRRTDRCAHPDATALARQIVTAQQGEIDAMRKMLDRL